MTAIRSQDNSLGNVLISGGASGLGAATVDTVVRRGGTPLVIDKKPPLNPNIAYVCADLADTAAVAAAVTNLAERVEDRIDGVFTAAGIDSCGALRIGSCQGLGAGCPGQFAGHCRSGAFGASVPQVE